MTLKSYKYRLYPTDRQKDVLEKHFGCVRFVYNWGLETKTKKYRETNKSISSIDLCNKLVELKQQHEWLNEVNSQSLQASLRNLDNAYTRFFRERKGFPNFKKKNSRQSFQCPQNNRINFETGFIDVIKIKNIKAILHREFEGKIKTVTITRTPTNKYFASVLVETSTKNKIPSKPNRKSAIGIDLGLKHFATISNGEKIENPKFLQTKLNKLKLLARRKDRKQEGSRRREKSKFKWSRLHEKIKNQRNDFLHKLSTRLIRENQSICVEDLNVNGMLKNRNLSSSISSVSWSTFINMLQYKAEWYGKNLIKIGRFEPSSKMCICGQINHELKLKARTWTCKECGATHDRDILAAKNILDFAFHKQNLIQYRAGHARINARGNDKIAEQKCSVVV